MDAPFRIYYQSPLGRLEIGGTDAAVILVRFAGFGSGAETPSTPVLSECLSQLDEYFQGRRTEFSVELAPAGTPFQREVWRAVRRIGFGRTTSYGEIARSIGHPDAARAVGAANGANPIPILVPCHRVIGKSGGLTGYGGGLWRKEWLLRHEQAGNGPLFA